MKSWIPLLLISMLSVPLLSRGQEAARPPVLTLGECLTIAQEHNRTLLISQHAVQKANGRLTEARGTGRAQVNLTNGTRFASEAKNIPLAVGIDGDQDLVFRNAPLSPDRTGYTAIGVSQVVDISGLITTNVNAASLGTQVAQRNVQSTRNDLLLQVKAAYYEILRSEALVVVAQDAIANAQTRRKTAQALVNAGISSKVDLFRADAAIAAAQQSLIASQNTVEVGKAGLNNLLGRDVNTPFAVQPPDEALAPVQTYEACLQEALTHRPEITAAQTNLQIADLQGILAQRGMKPSLVLNASAEYDIAHHVGGNPIGTVGAAIVFPLSDGGQTEGRMLQARSEIENEQLAVDDTRARVALDVKNAYVTLQNAGEKLATARKELDQAAESLRLSRIRYEQGIANQVEISDAELLYTQARTNVVNAQFAQLTAQAILERAMGRYA